MHLSASEDCCSVLALNPIHTRLEIVILFIFWIPSTHSHTSGDCCFVLILDLIHTPTHTWRLLYGFGPESHSHAVEIVILVWPWISFTHPHTHTRWRLLHCFNTHTPTCAWELLYYFGPGSHSYAHTPTYAWGLVYCFMRRIYTKNLEHGRNTYPPPF